jgi:hypothetical protein
LESCPEGGRAIAIRCRNALFNIPEFGVSEAVQDFLRGGAVLLETTELLQSTPVLKSEFRDKKKNSQGAYGRASEELAD